MKDLENKIRGILPRLQEIVKGQQFYSPYYGIITATKVTRYGNGKYGIYGFDEKEGLPRDNYYPRDLELRGFPIKLNDVLEFLNICFTTDNSASNTVKLFNSSENSKLKKVVIDNWHLSSVFLEDQSEELKEKLNTII